MNNRSLMENSMNVAITTRPIELYVFLDPFCDDCWSLQTLLRRLQIEYERYFTMRIALLTSLPTLNLQCIRNSEDVSACGKIHASFPSTAVKAAEFQGKRAGFRFLSKMFEYSYLKSRNVTSFSVLVEIAEKTKLDVEEFKRDFSSKHVLRSLQIDLYMAKEMEVTKAPTFVFFNENIEDEGLKVDGIHRYEVYEQILEELVGTPIYPEEPPVLEDLFQRYDTLSTKEIADIYRLSHKETERGLKKLLLQQEVERLTVQDTTLWRKK
ncbi:DsbA family protein [Sporosarcina sp. HYO08]|uniref:DsbA family protein n=1 Tax=Sporosarcina sp. HYO08 TaxID=1759557 RepID=UPI00079C4974|nr:DsbA family protein [Sporosarcina sp. HYO08]KXH79787.1 dithiol-disulfide isomerase [Sporosarcina sp. HYO08]